MIGDAKKTVNGLRLAKPNEYYIYASPSPGMHRLWVCIKDAEPVSDSFFGCFDFFTHTNGSLFVVSCGYTGAGSGCHSSRADAIVALKKGFKKIGRSGYYKFIIETIATKQGLSPRWQYPSESKRG